MVVVPCECAVVSDVATVVFDFVVAVAEAVVEADLVL